MISFLKERYLWYLAALTAFLSAFTYAPNIIDLIGLAPRPGLEYDFYVALYRTVFILAAAIAAWRFGVKGGLAACFTLALIMFSPYIAGLRETKVWIDVGVIVFGILTSWIMGRQGNMQRLLKKAAEELQWQTEKLSLEITERKRAEEEIRNSERHYRLLADNATDVIWTVDVDSPNRLTYISPSVTRLLGYSVEEARAKSMEEVFTAASYEIAMKALSEELAKADLVEEPSNWSRTLDLELRCKDGTIVPVEINSSFVRGPDGRVAEILVIAREISERKHVEEKIKHAAEEWRTTFDSISDLVSINDKEQKIVRVNTAFASTFNMKPQDVIGKYCYEVVHGTKEPLPNCPHIQTLKTKKPAIAECFLPDQEIYLQISTSPMFNEKGEIIGSVHIARDITERKQMEEQLIMTDRLASIGELVAGTAHELNNPLTTIIGFSQLLMEGNIPDDIREDLITICSEAERSAGIVKNLLSFARKHGPVKQVSKINSIIEDVLKLRAYEQKVSNIKVVTQFAPDLPEIMVDYFQMQQVFLNIVTNAENAMTEAHNGGTLTINIERIDNYLRVSCIDDGPGISKENMSQIFNPFFTTKEVGKGTGLGLSICHGIVTEHEGKIYAKSKSGKGTTFVVELPVNGY